MRRQKAASMGRGAGHCPAVSRSAETFDELKANLREAIELWLSVG